MRGDRERERERGGGGGGRRDIGHKINGMILIDINERSDCTFEII